MSFRALQGDQGSKVISYSYEVAGNLIEQLMLDYDGANRLVHLTHASKLGYTREASYRYDGLVRRISRTVRDTNGTTATTHYGCDGNRIVREETENQRTRVVYEPSSFVPILRIDDTQQGQIFSTYITDAWVRRCNWSPPAASPGGSPNPTTGRRSKNNAPYATSPNRSGFRGQWHDEESGLYYNRHRYYDPQQGRWIR